MQLTRQCLELFGGSRRILRLGVIRLSHSGNGFEAFGDGRTGNTLFANGIRNSLDCL